jgi:hypothetical protein
LDTGLDAVIVKLAVWPAGSQSGELIESVKGGFTCQVGDKFAAEVVEPM